MSNRHPPHGRFPGFPEHKNTDVLPSSNPTRRPRSRRASQEPCPGQASDGPGRKGWRRARRREDLLVVSFLLGKDPQAEVPVLVGLEGGRHHDVLARRQLEAVEHLPQVDVGVRPLPRPRRQEELLAQVDVGLSGQLVNKRGKKREWRAGGPGPLVRREGDSSDVGLDSGKQQTFCQHDRGLRGTSRGPTRLSGMASRELVQVYTDF